MWKEVSTEMFSLDYMLQGTMQLTFHIRSVRIATSFHSYLEERQHSWSCIMGYHQLRQEALVTSAVGLFN